MPKTILITGATSGIGQYLAAHLASAGHRLILHGRDRTRLDKVTSTISSGGGATSIVADLASADDLLAMFEELGAVTSHLDALIGNAFGQLEDPLDEASPADIQEFFATSLAGTALVMKGAIPFLERATEPCIVNIVADWGVPMHNIMTGPALYVAGKYGVHGLGAGLQMELGARGIRTTNLCPGIVASDIAFDDSLETFLAAHGDKAIHPAALAECIDMILAQKHAHVRSVVLSPRNPEYTGL